MESTFRIEQVNTQRELLLAIDVSKSSLVYRCEIPAAENGRGQRVVKCLSSSIARRSGPMQELFRSMHQIAREAGYECVRVLCESTGGFERPVLRMARRMGCLTSYVNGEGVNKLKVLDHNDHGKTDPIDTGVILTVGRLGKVLADRPLPPLYQQLRLLNRLLSSEELARVRARCELHYAVSQLFCDFSRKPAFFYSATGQALMEVYAFNPYRMVEAGQESLLREIGQKVRRPPRKILKELWADALSSSHHEMSPEEIALWERQVRYRWEDYQLHEKRRKQLAAEMVAIYEQLVAQNEPVPPAHKKFLGALSIARILAETGPLSDFPNPAALLKYAGLNLYRRQSGRFEGQVKTSHKGSVALRQALGIALYGQLRRTASFGTYYHRKKDVEKMCGTKAMTAVMRKALVIVWTLAVKRLAFDEQRLTQDESTYRKAA